MKIKPVETARIMFRASYRDTLSPRKVLGESEWRKLSVTQTASTTIA